MNLSKSFTLDEFTRSQTAARMGREVVAPPEVVANLTWLCQEILQPLRDSIRSVMTINSGYRPGWLNAAIGGSKTSQHMTGQAADILAKGYSPLGLCQEIVDHRLPFDQLLLEFDSWTHVSVALPGAKPRQQILTYRIVNGKTVIYPGLVPK
jgi:hypothetical protein